MIIENNILIKVDPNIAKIVVPEGVVEIGYSAFINSTVSELTLPSSLEKISAFAFSNCKKLSKVELPVGLKIIDSFAFAFSNISEINIPETVKVINMNAFAATPLINNSTDEFIILGSRFLYMYQGDSVEVTIPEGVKVICPLAFSKTSDYVEHKSGKKNPKIINCPNSLERICNDAFYRLIGLEELNLSSRVEIEENAFNECGLSLENF